MSFVPVRYRSPSWEFDRQIRFHFSSTLKTDIHLTHVFTDGSSLQPTDVRFRWATFAIVTQIAPDDILLTLIHSPPDKLLDQAFTTLEVGLCPGNPTVPRSELLAAVLSHEHAPNSEVVTDSAYVIFPATYRPCCHMDGKLYMGATILACLKNGRW